MLYCSNSIINEGLSLYIDIDNPRSWDGNPDLIVKSTVSDKYAVSDDIYLEDFGITAYDTGLSQTLDEDKSIGVVDKKITLSPVRPMDENGNPILGTYDMESMEDATIGKYFKLDGGYLTGFYALHGERFRLLPDRFTEGFTIETWVRNRGGSGTNDGIFIYMGCRSENKFSVPLMEDSHLSSKGNPLSGDHPDNPEAGIHNNQLALLINGDGKIGYRYIDHDGTVKEDYSAGSVAFDKWTLLSVTYRPYEIATPCHPPRLGDLVFYVDGREFFSVKHFREPWFYEMETEPEKQIGVPYTINWGGGSFGLKHSWHLGTGHLFPYEKVQTGGPLLIEKIFNGSFKGDIQKLRLYTKPLNPSDVWHNYKVESKGYSIKSNRGGRLIIARNN